MRLRRLSFAIAVVLVGLPGGASANPFSPPRPLELRGDPAWPRAMTTGDFDEDGVADLVVAGGDGSLRLHRGNVDALFPNSPAAAQRRREGLGSSAPFSPDPSQRIDGLPADLLVSGDFDADGHLDLAAGRRGGRELRIAFGDGTGRLGRPELLGLGGSLRSLCAADVNRRDGLADLLVGLATADGGGELRLLESPAGAARALPERFVAGRPVDAVAAGSLDDDFLVDLVATAGAELLLVHGRDRLLSLDEERRASVPLARVERRTMTTALASVAAGPFLAADGGRDSLALLDVEGEIAFLPHSGRPLAEREPAPVESPGEGPRGGGPTSLGLVVGGWNGPDSTFSLVVGGSGGLELVHEQRLGGGAPGRILRRRFGPAAEVLAALPLRLSADPRPALVLALDSSPDPLVVAPSLASTFTVTSAGDGADAVVGDGSCADAGGACTLRAALQEANATPAADSIVFSIPAAVPVAIQPATSLPIVTAPVIVDATNQPGFSGTPAVELDLQFSSAVAGLTIQAAATVRGLAINRCQPVAGYGIGISLQPGSSGSFVEGNHVGTNPAGTLARPNSSFGLDISETVTGVTIGGTVAAARNLLSGNGAFGARLYGTVPNTIAGNYIGLGADGATAIGNAARALDFAPGSATILGGTAAGSRNVISSNGGDGVALSGSVNGLVPTAVLVQGNYIGTDATGTLDRGNNGDGVRVDGSLNVVGGTSPAARNVISGNGNWGVQAASTAPADAPLLQGNVIGLNAAGTASLPNSLSGLRHFAPGLVVGGTAAGAGNVISGNTNYGIEVSSSATGSAIQGNRIGTSADGTADLGNGLHGIWVYGTPALQIGGTASGAGNQISGNNQSGISVQLAGSAGTAIEGNRIGVAADGVTLLPNSLSGVQISSSATGVRVGGSAAGAGNVIAGNGSAGVTVSSGVGSAVSRNSIFANTGIGIDLGATGATANDAGDPDSGANRLQNKPVLSCASLVSGGLEIEYAVDTLTSHATYPLTVEFFEADSSAGGEGRTFLGSDVWSAADLAAGSRRAAFAGAAGLGVVSGDPVVATATDAAGNTSEFSAVRSVRAGLVPPPQLTVGGAACGTSPTIPDSTPTLAWSDVTGESSYQWEVRSGGCGATVVASGTTSANVTSVTVTSELADGSYTWRVRARGDGGAITCDGAWSCACPFTVACPTAPTPSLVSVDAQGCGGAIASTDPSPTIAWTDVVGDAGYSWEIWTGAGCTGTRARFGSTLVDVASAVVSPDLPGGTYSWRVRANGDGSTICASAWSCGCPFDQACLVPPAPTQVSVAGQPCGGTISTTDPTPTLDWSNAPGGIGYEWELYSGSACGGTLLLGGTTGAGVSWVDVPTQLPDGTYSWRVRALGDGTAWCTGPWSCACPFTVDCVEVTSPALLTVDGAACGGSPIATPNGSPTLAWSDVPDDSGYEWEVWSGAGCTGTRAAFGTTGISQTSATLPAPLLGGTYFWRVRALGNDFATCASPWSCGCPFSVPCLVAPPPPLLSVDGLACGPFLAPADPTPTLAWGGVAGASGYAWELRSGVDCSGTLVASGTTAAGVTSVESPALAVGTYHWQVRALGDGTVLCDGPFACGCPFTLGSPSCDTTPVAGGTLSGNVSWPLSGSPYVVASTVTVAAGSSLSIAPGVIVKFAPGSGLVVQGTLLAPGTAADRIVFTSIDDHAACGPTAGGDGSPSAGDWSGLSVDGIGAALSGSGLVVRYASTGLNLFAGGTALLSSSDFASCGTAIRTAGDSSPTFTNVDLTGCATCLALVRIEGSSKPTFTNGAWSGAGFLGSAGQLAYNTPGTPDPTFSGISVSGMGPAGHAALDVWDAGSGIAGTTRWAGLDFWIGSMIEVASGGRVDAAGATLLFAPSSGASLEVAGTLDLGAVGQPVTLRSGSATPAVGDWAGVRYLEGSAGTVTNAVVRDASTAFDISTSGVLTIAETDIRDCGTALRTLGNADPVFTNVDLTGCSTCMMLVAIEGNSKPTFDGGTWDGGGFLSSAGQLAYNLAGTPDPTFSGITITNMAPWGHAALDITDVSFGITGETRWANLDFWIESALAIAAGGKVDVANATLLFAPNGSSRIEASGTLQVGSAGQPVTLRSGSSFPSSSDWGGLRFLAGSSGGVTNATLRDAFTGLEVSSAGSVSVSDSAFFDCGTAVRTLGSSAPVFTNVDLTGCSTCMMLVAIEGNSTPTFGDGTWDGAGSLWSAGQLVYDDTTTPDPVFSGIDILNMAPWGHHALDIVPLGPISGPTHWANLDFWISSAFIAPGGQVDVANATLRFESSGASLLQAEGVLNLGTATGPVTLRSGSSTPAVGDWSSVRYASGSSGTITNTTIRDAATGLEIDSAGSVVVSDSALLGCGTAIKTFGSSAPVFTNVDLTGCSTCWRLVVIEGSSTPTFDGGTWDGAGSLWSAGQLVYNNPGTPDPSFSGIVITNMSPPGNEALEIIDYGDGILGTTHWANLDFGTDWLIKIAPGGRVDISDATVWFAPGATSGLETSGILNLGAAGAPVVLRSTAPPPAAGSWRGVRYLAGSTGVVTNATIRDAIYGLEIQSSGSVAVSESAILDCVYAVRTLESAAPTFTNVDLTGCTTCWMFVAIEGSSNPTFNGGTWDGAGALWTAGQITYNSPGTPDPSFSGIGITSMAPGVVAALDLADLGSGIVGTTHWANLDFRINSSIAVAPGGRVDVANATVFFPYSGTFLSSSGTLNLGDAGAPVLLRSANALPAAADWGAVRYLAGSTGTVRNTTIRHASTGIDVATTGAVRVESTLIDECIVAARTTGAAQPDFGSGGTGSPGRNLLVGSWLDFDHGSSAPVSARFNQWSCSATAQMDAGMTDIDAINDLQDDPLRGAVDFSDWLGGSHRIASALADTAAGARDVLLDWPDELPASLTILRGSAPEALAIHATTTAGSWRDVGGLDDPSPTLFYLVTGPCP